MTAANVRERADIVDELLRLPYLTPEQAALVVSTSASTVRRECAAGRLRAVRLASKQWRITPNALRDYLTPKPTAIDRPTVPTIAARQRSA